jgi:hypothetical protein
MDKLCRRRIVKKAIELLRDLKLDIHNLLVDKHSVLLKDGAIKLVGAIINELQSPPRWETPEQYRERTKEAWPDNGAVYWKWADDDAWTIGKYSVIRDGDDPFGVWVICATEAGPPPDGWRPEK